MNQLVCRGCGLEFSELEARTEPKTFSNGTNHVEAFCPGCGRHVKYMPQGEDADIKFQFGKYKGQKVIDIAKFDPGYLEWAMQTIRGNRRLKRVIESAIRPKGL